LRKYDLSLTNLTSKRNPAHKFGPVRHAGASGYGSLVDHASLVDTVAPVAGARWGDVATALRLTPLLATYILLLVLKVVLERDNHVFVYLFLASFFALKLPFVMLVARLVLSASFEDGPTHASKFTIGVAAALNLAADLPLEVWTQVLPDNCPFHFAGWVDLILAFYAGSVALWFVFARNEFRRNRDECVWSSVSRLQETFDIRAF
jgi:hypothetical protein